MATEITTEQRALLDHVRFYKRYAGLRPLVEAVEALLAAYDGAREE